MAMLRQCLNSAVILWFSTSLTWAAAPTRTYSYVSGQVIDPSQVTTNEDNFFSYLQAGVDTYVAGSIPTAAIADSAVTTAKLGNGSVTGAKMATMTNGQLPIGNGTNATFATLTGTDIEIDITNAAGSITIGLVDPLAASKGGTGATSLASVNVGTATALAANGANCSAGNYPLGVNASGAVESCTAAATGLTFSGGTASYDSSTASGTQVLTISGITPAFCMFIMVQDASQEASIGFDDLTNPRVLIHEATGNNFTGQGGRSIEDQENGTGTSARALITSVASGSATLTWTKTGSPTGSLDIRWSCHN